MFDLCAEMLMYLTAAVIIAAAAAGIIVRYYKKDKLPVFYNYILGLITGYSIAAGALMLTLKFYEIKAEGYFNPQLFYPILALLIMAVLLVIGWAAVSVFKPQWKRNYLIGAFTLTALYILALIVLEPLKGYMYEVYTTNEQLALAFSTIIAAAILIVIPLVFGKKTEVKDTKAIVYAAVTIALSFALSYIRLFKLPQGGSITFASLLPLMVYSYMFGVRRGVTACAIYGVLQAIQEPWILHPLQFLLEYPLAFGMFGLTGILKEVKFLNSKPVLQLIIGGVGAAVIRYLCHVVAGVVIWGVPEEYSAQFNVYAWSFLYNSFVFVDIAIALAAGAFMFASKTIRKSILTVN